MCNTCNSSPENVQTALRKGLGQNSKMACTTCPVFYPTENEFRNFSQYVSGISDSVRDNFGMIKVVPPSGFFTRDYSILTLDTSLTVKSPVKQLISGRAGVYSVDLVPQPDMSVGYFFALAHDTAIDTNTSMEERERLFWKKNA